MAVTFDARALERIQTTARDIDPVRVAVAVVSALPYILGWVLAKSVSVAWLALSWAVAAGKVGWQDARRPRSEMRSGWGG